MKRWAIGAALLVLASCAGKHAEPTPSVPGTTPRMTAAPSSATADPAGVYAHVGSDALTAAARGALQRVYVPNSKSNTVDVIDPFTMRVVDHFDVGVLPQHVTPSWDFRHLYVDNDRSNTLTEIDPKTGRPVRTIPVDDPYNLYFTPDGSSAIVVAERLRRLDFRDPATWKLTGSIRIPHAGPNHLDFSPDGRYLLISCEFSGFVEKVDLATRTIVGEANVGGKPADVRVSPTGRVFYVANERRAGVSIVDPKAMREIGFIRTGYGAHGFVVSRDGRNLYVTNRLGGSVSVIDFETRKLETTWVFGGSPDMGGVSVDGSSLWLSGRYDGVVYVIDTRTGKLKATIRVGREPHGVCVFPQPGRYSLGHTGNDR